MSCYRRLAKAATSLLLRARAPRSPASEMHRALHSNSIASHHVGSSAFFSTFPTRTTHGYLPHLSAVRQQQQHSGSHSCSQPAPLLAHRRSWRPAGGYIRPSAAAAGFTASTPSHGKPVEDDGPEGELHAVETAIRANALIFAAKLAVFFISNSSAMLAEAVHSVVDIANQMLLRIGIKKAQRQPNEIHPYGYARDQFIWPLISAVGIFCCGAGVSFVHGVTGLFEVHKELGDLYWNFVVLGVSGVLESHSLYVAVDTLRRRAAQQGMSLLSYIKTGADPAATAVMMEDGAAVAGLFIAGGCLALCQITGAVYWDAVGSIAVSALLGVVAITLIQRNRKWLIGKSMPKAQEDQILEHLVNDHVIRHVSNIKSEELGVRQYRFQADIAFDGEELARRALDRCGRVRLFKALDAAIRRHDPHALDALLMQFAAVIVSTTGAEVDRMEREIMRLVPGTRWVDLETDRGKPARLSSAYAAAAAAATAGLQQQQQGGAAAAPAAGQAPQEQQPLQQQHQQQDPRVMRQVRPLDSVGDADHLAELEEYPLGSLGSFSSWDDVHDNVPEWIETFTPDVLQGNAGGRSSSRGGGGGGGPARLTGADANIVGGNYLSHEQMHAIEQILVEGSEQQYKPFCNTMLQQLQVTKSATSSSSSSREPPRPPMTPASATSVVSVSGGSSSSSGSAVGSADGLKLSWEVSGVTADAATQQQLADWAASERMSWTGAPPRSSSSSPAYGRGGAVRRPAAAQVGIGPGSTQSFCDVMGEQQQQQQQQQLQQQGKVFETDLAQEDAWGQEHKRKTMQKLLDLEDSVLARDGDKDGPKPFCETMFQALHPNQPKSRKEAAAAAAAARQQQQGTQQQPGTQQQWPDTDADEPEPKQHSA